MGLYRAVLLLQFIPARGRKPPHARRPPSTPPGCNLSPRGDGNEIDYGMDVQPGVVAIYPREGTETRNALFFGYAGLRCNLSPRGDGNIKLLPDSVNGCRCNLSPRGDGNGKNIKDAGNDIQGCNLSPRGDGNQQRGPFFPLAGGGCNLSPRGDGNNAATGTFTGELRCNLSPRGDGNPVISSAVGAVNDRCNLSPRGDGNPSWPLSPEGRIPLQFIPARGRKQKR